MIDIVFLVIVVGERQTFSLVRLSLLYVKQFRSYSHLNVCTFLGGNPEVGNFSHSNKIDFNKLSMHESPYTL